MALADVLRLLDGPNIAFVQSERVVTPLDVQEAAHPTVEEAWPPMTLLRTVAASTEAQTLTTQEAHVGRVVVVEPLGSLQD